MNALLSTLNQIGFLFGFILIGYTLGKCGVLPQNTATVLSKLENFLFIPALVMGSFISNFTVERIAGAATSLLVSSIILILVVPLSIGISRATSKDKYIQNIYTYGLAFSNFGFMGNAVVSKLFPDIFLEYVIFCLPLWILNIGWGLPHLLVADANKQRTLKDTAKSFINPMFIAMMIGMVIGVIQLPVPEWIMSVITVSGECMSPIAMILTGVVVSSISLKKAFRGVGIYVISIIRLIIIPGIFMIVASFFDIPKSIYICALCTLAMPLGLNAIVIPSGLGRDTSVAAGMTIVSHLLSCITIPLFFSFI